MSAVTAILKRELASYFATPLAAVFIVIFLMLAGAFTFYLGDFFEIGQADLQVFFRFHPWLYLLLAPAMAMRLWAEERKSGTLELLLTQPVTLWQAVLGKFLAAWLFLGLALVLTFPIWITVNWLGSPDNGVILAGYLGSWLMAGAFLAVGSCLSALTRSQVLAFILTVLVCLLLLLAGFPLALDLVRAVLPQSVVDAVSGLSFLTHFQSITRGLLDLRDVFFFLFSIAAWLLATVLVIEIKKSDNRRARILLLPSLALLFVALVALSSYVLRGVRLDLTEHKQYTLSEGTRHILERIREPVRLQLFYSEKTAETLPQFRVFAQRVRELLEEAAARSHGKVTLDIIDPEPFSEAEDKAAAYGLQAVPVGTGGDSLYFGLVGTNTTDGETTMPFIQPDKEAFLEYDLAKLVTTLTEDQKPVLAVLSGLPTGPGVDPASGQPSLGWVVDRKLSELFEMRRLQANPTSIGADVKLLLVVHPKDISDDAQYAIDQFVLRGGHLLVFVDPDAESDPTAAGLEVGSPDSGRSSDLPRLFKSWGLAFDPNKVVLDAQNALQVQPDPNQPPVLHPGILGLGRSLMNQKDVVTADLETVNLSSAGALALAPGSPLRLEPLIQSSANATLGDAAIVRAAASAPGLLAQKYPPGTAGPFVLAGRLTGKLKTAFPERTEAGHLAASQETANLLVVADTDVLADRLWVQVQNFLGQPVYNPFANNGDFVFNAVDNLVGNNDLIAVRTRVDSNRPFEKVQVMRRAAEARFQARELELQKQLDGLEQKLSQLQPANSGQAQALNREQQAQLLQFQQQKLATRKELRDVQRQLNARIDTLGKQLKLVNILGMPLLVVLAALVLALRRRLSRQESGA